MSFVLDIQGLDPCACKTQSTNPIIVIEGWNGKMRKYSAANGDCPSTSYCFVLSVLIWSNHYQQMQLLFWISHIWTAHGLCIIVMFNILHWHSPCHSKGRQILEICMSRGNTFLLVCSQNMHLCKKKQRSWLTPSG